MKCRRLLVAPAIIVLAVGVAGAAPEKPTVYTGEDLDRMFGPAPRSPSEPVDKSGPGDWQWVEQFLDRQYARIDADRNWDLNRRTLDIAQERTAPRAVYPYGAVSWGLGYPASTWWQSVWSSYSGLDDDEHRRHREPRIFSQRGRGHGHGRR